MVNVKLPHRGKTKKSKKENLRLPKYPEECLHSKMILMVIHELSMKIIQLKSLLKNPYTFKLSFNVYTKIINN